MSTNYDALKAENVIRYGTDIAEVGAMLLADRYEERTHFIFELLQNAEDALRRRTGWTGSREVVFELVNNELRVSHFGQPFTENDVRGICSIGKSTKNITEIGRFGIGFKSVYVYSNSPEIHSGDESFAVDSYVWPRAAKPFARQEGQTLIRLPLDAPDADPTEIEGGLRSLSARALLFLRQIDQVSWRANGAEGNCRRLELGAYGTIGRRVRLLRQDASSSEESDWLVFSKAVSDAAGVQRGFAEIAFAIDRVTDAVVPVADSNLVAYFPTALPANVGFLIQAPFRTTPSRDNIPKADSWNKHLITQVSELLVSVLETLATEKLLTIEALQCLPLDRARFPDTHMLAPLFAATKDAFQNKQLLPTLRGGYVRAPHAKIGRTAEVRRLFGSSQLKSLFDTAEPVQWLNDGITQDRTPELRRYLMTELGIDEVTPETLFPRLSKTFLEEQSDAWIVQLYGVLLNLPALLRRLPNLPWVRLESGTHVTARLAGQPQAFLPTDLPSEFPTVKAQLAQSPQARLFFRQLGVTTPDPVDEVIRHVLPRYAPGTEWSDDKASDQQYETDIAKIMVANSSDSSSRRTELIEALKKAQFVRAVSLGKPGSKYRCAPGLVYLATARLKSLFDGVEEVYLVDDRLPCLRGDEIRTLLETCGAARHVQPIPTTSAFTWAQKQEMRIKGGCEDITREVLLRDFTLRGLDGLLKHIRTLPLQEAAERGAQLWGSLRDLMERRGQNAFQGTYQWFYHYSREHRFDAAFVRRLRSSAWVSNGQTLVAPAGLDFGDTHWAEDAALLSLIPFRPPIVTQLAEQVGIEAEALDLLKQLGVTSVSDLRARLNLDDGGAEEEDGAREEAEEDDDEADVDADVDADDHHDSEGGAGRDRGGDRNRDGDGRAEGSGGGGGRDRTSSNSSGGGSDRHEFISYVAVRHEHDDDDDPDGLTTEQRQALENLAIEAILKEEPSLRRTPPGNAGFDLFEADDQEAKTRWVEVKAMRGALKDRPVGLSRTQFMCAQERLDAYWLYVVEHAGLPGAERIVRIRNPAGRGRTFTFDAGWAAVAEDAPSPAELA